MMNMKRVFVLLLVLGMMACLCACGEANQPVVTTQPTTEATVPTTEATEPEQDAEPTYVVTVVDQNNEPVVGAWVQLCLEACVPAMTDDNGVANFFLEEADYKVGFTVMPAGYEYAGEEEAWYFADGENTITIVINKVAE